MLKVLIVDDDKNVCECIRRMIPWKDISCCDPFIAGNGLEAWELLQREKIDFIICDLRMPVMGGIELCIKMRENGFQTYIVFLSAYEDFSIARQAMQYKVLDYILKPIDTESLENLEKIIRNINSTKKRKELTNKFFDEDYNRQIFEACANRDISFLNNMFESLKQLDEQDSLYACFSLLHILYRYMCSVNKGIERSVYDAILEKQRKDLMDQPDLEKKIAYVHAQYHNELEKTNTDNCIDFSMRQIRQLVKENFNDPDCSVAWIARELHLTSAYVGRIFNKYMGISLMEYITECRLKEACLLLTNENISINDVARKVGYLNCSYFIKLFRGKIGLSPSEYRRKNKQL